MTDIAVTIHEQPMFSTLNEFPIKEAAPKEFMDTCKCGAESEYGCHGVRNGELYDEYLCKKCYNRSKQ